MNLTTTFWDPLLLSIKIALTSTPITLIVAMFFVKVLQKGRKTIKLLIELVLLLPLVLPPSVVGFVLIVIFGRSSLIGKWIDDIFHTTIMFTWWAGVIAAIIVSIPLMYQSLVRGFSEIDQSLLGAAKVDGSNGWQLFWRIELPLALPAIISGITLSFARAVGEFGATLMFAGNIPNKTQTTATAIYSAMEAGNMKLAWTLVGILIIFSFLLLTIIQLIGYRRNS